MNTKIYHSLYTLLVAGALLASGCSKDDDTYDFYAAHPDAVRFHITADGTPQTRVTTEGDGSSFVDEDRIAISADGGTSYSNYVQSSGDDWQPASGQSYLRWKEQTLSFQAYYPVIDEMTHYTYFRVPTNQGELDNLRIADYMTASATDQSPASPVKLTFKHQLAKVTVSITLGEEVKGKEIQSISFYTFGNILENGNITNNSLYIGYRPYHTGETYTAILPPQSENSSAAFIKVLFNNTNYPLTGIPALEPGKAYTLALQVGHDGVKLVSPITVKEWGKTENMTGGTATLKPEYYSWYTTDPNAETFTLSTADELRAFAKLVNGDPEALAATTATAAVNFEGKTVQIATDATELDLSGNQWTPIGINYDAAFKGSFDGNRKTVSGVNINIASGNNVGFFAYLDGGGSVKNLRIKGNVTATTSSDVGGIVGNLLNGTIEHCAFQGTVKGNAFVGGIVGYSKSGTTLTACFASGSVEATNSQAGGIVGSNYTTITHCYSSAEVTAKGTNSGNVGGIAGLNSGNISHCYATGKITANNQAGGIAGATSNGSVLSNCIALNAEVSSTGNQFFGRVAGLNGSGTLTDNAAWTGMTLPDGISPDDDANGKDGKSLTATECLTKTTYTTTYGFDETEWAFSDKPTWDYLPWNQTLYQYWGTDVRIAVPSHLKP